MKKLSFLLTFAAPLMLCPRVVHAQGVVEYGVATSAVGSLGAKLGSALGSALNNASTQTTETVIKNAPSAPSQKLSPTDKVLPAKPPKTGPASVLIESNPPGAAVLIDGVAHGETPATLSLAKGIHVIQVSHDGFDSWQQTLLLSEGENLSLKPVLKDPKISLPRFTVQR
jgi:hypothetical protein